MIVLALGIALGAAAGSVTRLVPMDLGVAAGLLGGMVPMLIAAAVLIAAWSILVRAARLRHAGPRVLLLAVGSLPVAAMLAAGPVAGLYLLLWPAIVVMPAILVVASRPANV